MSHVAVYCTYDAFSEVVLFPESHPELFTLINKHAKLTLDLDDALFLKKVKEDPFLWSYYKQTGGGLKADKALFNSFSSSGFNYASYTGSIFIVDHAQSVCANILKAQGLLVLSAGALNGAQLYPALHYSWSWIPKERKTFTCSLRRNYEGWGAILKPVTENQLPVTTSIIISDDYLLADSDNDFVAENIFSIVKGFAPSATISLELEVLVIAGDSKPRTTLPAIDYARLDRLIGKLHSLSASLKPLTIRYGFLTHPIDPQKFKGFHERFIITDYSISSSEHGFLDFRGAEATQANDLNYGWAFYNLNNKVGADIPLKKMRQKLDAIKDLKAIDNSSMPSTYLKRGHTDIRLLIS